MSEHTKRDGTLCLVVTDMACEQCERNVERAALSVEGVTGAQANAKTGEVMLELSGKVRRHHVERAIRHAGYTPQVDATRTWPKLVLATCSALVLAALLGHLEFVGTTLPALNNVGSLDVWGFALVGFLSSVHCVSMCGGLVALGVVGRGAGVRQAATYNIGRIVSYSFVGMLLGAFGSVVSVSAGVRLVLGIVAAAAMILVGMSLTGYAPWSGRLLPLLPSSLRSRAVRASRGRPLLVGLANGLMPCGPLQAVQLVAVTSGSALLGALDLAMFCLGTVPLMMVFGIAASRVSSTRRRGLAVGGGVVVMALGVTMIAGNLALAGVNVPLLLNDGNMSVLTKDENVQVVQASLEPNAYPSFSVHAGKPVRLELQADPRSLNGCNGSVVMPEWGVKKDLVEGLNIIEFTPAEPGEYVYSCWMGMIRAKVTVLP